MRNTRPWNCGTVQERLTGYACGDTSEVEEDAVRQHLRVCAVCREGLVLERELIDTAETDAPGAVPHGFAASVLKIRHGQRLPDTFRRALVLRWMACFSFAFHSFIDPLLWAEYRLHGALVSRLRTAETALSALRSRLLVKAQKVYRQITVPLKLACKQVYTPLAGKVLP